MHQSAPDPDGSSAAHVCSWWSSQSTPDNSKCKPCWRLQFCIECLELLSRRFSWWQEATNWEQESILEAIIWCRKNRRGVILLDPWQWEDGCQPEKLKLMGAKGGMGKCPGYESLGIHSLGTETHMPSTSLSLVQILYSLPAGRRQDIQIRRSGRVTSLSQEIPYVQLSWSPSSPASRNPPLSVPLPWTTFLCQRN